MFTYHSNILQAGTLPIHPSFAGKGSLIEGSNNRHKRKDLDDYEAHSEAKKNTSFLLLERNKHPKLLDNMSIPNASHARRVEI